MSGRLDSISGFIGLPESDIFIRPARSPDFADGAVPPLVLAIGVFDGVHRGHRKVIGAAAAEARSVGGWCGVLTFHPHPSRLFRPDDPTLLLMPAHLKTQRLFDVGVDAVIWRTFSPSFAAVEAEDFLRHIQQGLPTLHSIHVGENFRFGRGRRGNVSILKITGKALNIAVHGEPRLAAQGDYISSSRIRELLLNGSIEKAGQLLGEPYRTVAEVTPGKRLGRQLGFPTLNLPWAPELLPRFGVYAVTVRKCGESLEAGLPAVANFGIRPTVEETVEPRLECHLLTESCPYSTGDVLVADWLHFMRPEVRFDSVDALKRQIAQDRATAGQWFHEQGRAVSGR